MSHDATIERLYVLDAGIAQVEDASIYSPGFNVGKPMTLSCNAYLIRHRGQWMLWDTGTQDDLIGEPQGRIIAHGIRGTISKTIASQLQEIGVEPDEIGTLALSHAHYDHVGNCRLFTKAEWIVQKAEYEAMFGPDPGAFGFSPELYGTLRNNKLRLIEGDHDVFGDGAVRIILTPGHTPGHCSLLLNLPEAGRVLLSGDVAHNRRNFQCRCVPSFNVDALQSIASMNRVEELLETEGATLFVNHDVVQNATLPHAPDWLS
ncbi:N-acyl homoserine lactonase family protein [Caballeronia mineralivorans]|uniref:N-acyl homoserine lactonase family protein n=1 Tax=Caballeronia mineralivorans TaxID=2010198 RepID=UPI0023F072ED|nr:N-acyl homoserine lactonase family protein [Caballeronia mineralivorans]MDB5782299.1 metallo-beta-lactamase family protein [Caballeronia mineralivorans]MEA3105128.1 N-acyl homoserine lactone hydrolase [Caballeronia mineralivorans]